MRDPRLIITIEQLLAIWDRRGRDRVRDGRPHGACEEDPSDRGPPGVRDHALQDVVGVALDDEALVGYDCGAGDDEPDEDEVEDGLAADEDAPHAAEEAFS
jgi:hypothetical protein